MTAAYSNRAAKTKSMQKDIQMSIAFIYDTFGNELEAPDVCVVIVRTVVMPRAVRAGAASILIQKETQLRTTMSSDGTYNYNYQVNIIQ